MFFSIATTCQPATDLGYLLAKHPDRLHEVELAFGHALVLFPEASDARCEAALILDVDPIGLVRGRGDGDGLLDQYVNDRPYAASSFLSVALVRAFRTAMTGRSKERQALADTAIPLEIVVTPVPVRRSEELVATLFEPLGWRVAVERLDGPSGPSRYATIRLAGALRVADALSHVYVLLPVLDDEKHYWVGDDEVEKLVAKGETWLPAHPARELIAKRYLKGRRGLVRAALARLAPEEEAAAETPEEERAPEREEALEAPIRLHDLRLDTVAAALAEAGAASVADLGCGEGKLLARLAKDKRFSKLVGLDAASRALERAAQRLKLDQGRARERITLLHGALTYRDVRWHGCDAAALVEVIEHLEPERLATLAEVVFGAARPRIVVVTTPNVEHNALFETLPAGHLRHLDHRFEWTRAEFSSWADGIERRFGYKAAFAGIGADDPVHGPITQMAVFSR